MNQRHQKTFNKNNSAPYELSRSRVENFVNCPACFYLQQVKAISFPSIPGFNINEATDILLKRDFDRFRGKNSMTHPFLNRIGEKNLVPLDHEDLGKWRDSLHYGSEGRLNTIHHETNLKIGGGLDDVYINKQTNKLHIVDYKSTSVKTKDKTISLDDPWKGYIKRQMDIYVWILRRKGFDVSDIGYFLYCDGDRFSEYDFLGDEYAFMKFKMYWLPYKVDLNWIEPTLFKIKELLLKDICPDHSENCEYGLFLNSLNKI